MAGKYQAYSEYKESGVDVIGSVPKHWVVSRLKQIVDQNRQITYGIVQAGPNKKNGIPYIRPADMSDECGVKNYNDLLQTSHEIAANFERSKIKAGDIICSIGPSFGKLMITPNRLDGANLTQGTARVAISLSYNAKYFFWALRSTSSFQQWESSVGGATFRALNLGPLADTFVVVPKEDEQEKIANFLDHATAKIDTLIDKQQQLITLLKEKRQAVISHAVTKGLKPNAPMRDSGVEWLGKVPEHWGISKLKYLTTQIVDGAHFTPTYVDEGVPFLRVTDVHSKVIDMSNIKYIPEIEHQELIKRCNPERGDLLLSKNGTIGVPKVVDWDWEFSVFVSLCLIKLTEKLDVHYAYYFFKTHEIKEQILGQIKQSTVINLHLDKIEKFDFTVPPLDEQIEIVEYLDKIIGKYDLQVTKAAEMNVLLIERRTALISAAVTGKIDVRNWQAPAPSKNHKEVAA
jgi:type I restriction enzyme S subunit